MVGPPGIEPGTDRL